MESVSATFLLVHDVPQCFYVHFRWEPLEEKPEPGQWEYFGKAATASS